MQKKFDFLGRNSIYNTKFFATARRQMYYRFLKQIYQEIKSAFYSLNMNPYASLGILNV
jgi:hypothetical protein